MTPRRTLRILGIRGVPAAHGGFETFAEELARHLVARGWRVVVYCQEDEAGPVVEDVWCGIERVRIPVALGGAKGTVLFDALSIRHAARHGDLCLTLGYNTAVFCAWLRLRGVRNLINMDGIEWRRSKWGPVARVWFWLNERAGCRLGDHLVADHEAIRDHLATRTRAERISVIRYGAAAVHDAPLEPLATWGLQPRRYLTLIARPEPENSILEAVGGFSCRARGVKLVVLGRYDDHNPYHRAVREAASDEVLFVGAIYDPSIVRALRFYGLAYVHGHRVGGTNPSLVEALGAGNAVIAHDNPFNRGVAGEAARCFRDGVGFDRVLSALLADPSQLDAMRAAARGRFAAAYTWPAVLEDYERLLLRFAPDGSVRAPVAGDEPDGARDDREVQPQ